MTIFFSYCLKNMFQVRLLIVIMFYVTSIWGDEREIIIDLYNKINTYGSLLKATTFDLQTQLKLKNINTIRMDSYEGLFIRKYFY